MMVVLTPPEMVLASCIGFDENILRLVKAALHKDTIEPYDQYVYSGDGSLHTIGADFQSGGKGFEVRLPGPAYDKTWHLDELYKVRRLLPRGYSAFSTDDHTSFPSITLLKTEDSYEIIRVRGTHGWDFKDRSYTSEDLIRVIAGWQQRCKLDVIGAGASNVRLVLDTLPDNPVAFAEEINHLCWELDQVNHLGFYGDSPEEDRIVAEKLAASMRATRRLYLWWD